MPLSSCLLVNIIRVLHMRGRRKTDVVVSPGNSLGESFVIAMSQENFWNVMMERKEGRKLNRLSSFKRSKRRAPSADTFVLALNDHPTFMLLLDCL